MLPQKSRTPRGRTSLAAHYPPLTLPACGLQATLNASMWWGTPSTTTICGLIRSWPRAVALIACLGSSGTALAQPVRITSPPDGTVVNSGQVVVVTVEADPSAVESVGLNSSCVHTLTPELTRPPYQFSIRISADEPSGDCALSAVGTPKSGTEFLLDAVGILVERPDLPRKLAANHSVVYFSHAGAQDRNSLEGTFPDGSRVLLTNSKYLTYSSDHLDVATIGDQGVVTAVGPGSASITITYGNATIGAVAIRVPVFVPYPVTVTPPKISLHASEQTQFAASVSIDERLDQSVTWSIEPAVGTITSDGVYTAPGALREPANITVKATSVADPTKSALAHLRVLPRRTR